MQRLILSPEGVMSVGRGQKVYFSVGDKDRRYCSPSTNLGFKTPANWRAAVAAGSIERQLRVFSGFVSHLSTKHIRLLP
ncbi:MAG: hypothetical protein ACRCZS_04310, partial [Chroococcidiopsis sp.]